MDAGCEPRRPRARAGAHPGGSARRRPARGRGQLPLERCVETATEIAARSPAGADGDGTEVRIDARLGECRYGDWTGRDLADLAKEPLWRTVQEHPSAAVFPGPGGEALRETQTRGIAAIRDWNDRLGSDATWLACSHADVIKTVVADAMGMHLDLFQRITIDTCSLTVIRYTERRPFLLRLNDLGGSVADLLADQPPPADEADAVVGGSAGPSAL